MSVEFRVAESSEDLLIRITSIYDVNAYKQVKRISMQLAHDLEEAIRLRVGGWEEKGCDAATVLGKWEFCMQKNTKNHAGKRADETRCPGRCVQILGTPNPGWISGRAFLEMHGVPPDEMREIIERVVETITVHEQMRFPI